MDSIAVPFEVSIALYRRIHHCLPRRGRYVVHGMTAATAGVTLLALAYFGALFNWTMGEKVDFKLDPVHEFNPLKGALLTLSFFCFCGTVYCFKIVVSKDPRPKS